MTFKSAEMKVTSSKHLHFRLAVICYWMFSCIIWLKLSENKLATHFLFSPAFVIWCICFFIVQYRKSCLRRSFKYLMQTICVSCLRAARCRKNCPIFCLNSKPVDNNRSWGEKAKWEVIGAAELPFIGKFGTDSSCSFSTGLFNNYSFTIMTIRPASSDSVKYFDF